MNGLPGQSFPPASQWNGVVEAKIRGVVLPGILASPGPTTRWFSSAIDTFAICLDWPRCSVVQATLSTTDATRRHQPLATAILDVPSSGGTIPTSSERCPRMPQIVLLWRSHVGGRPLSRSAIMTVATLLTPRPVLCAVRSLNATDGAPRRKATPVQTITRHRQTAFIIRGTGVACTLRCWACIPGPSATVPPQVRARLVVAAALTLVVASAGAGTPQNTRSSSSRQTSPSRTRQHQLSFSCIMACLVLEPPAQCRGQDTRRISGGAREKPALSGRQSKHTT